MASEDSLRSGFLDPPLSARARVWWLWMNGNVTQEGIQKDLDFAAATADRLGLELAIAASPGWSETGGPWVPPADGMKKLVWSETILTGGRSFSGTLASPPRITGTFADVPRAPGIVSEEAQVPEHYEDVAVVGFPVAERPSSAPPRMTAAAHGSMRRS